MQPEKENIGPQYAIVCLIFQRLCVDYQCGGPPSRYLKSFVLPFLLFLFSLFSFFCFVFLFLFLFFLHFLFCLSLSRGPWTLSTHATQSLRHCIVISPPMAQSNIFHLKCCIFTAMPLCPVHLWHKALFSAKMLKIKKRLLLPNCSCGKLQAYLELFLIKFTIKTSHISLPKLLKVSCGKSHEKLLAPIIKGIYCRK